MRCFQLIIASVFLGLCYGSEYEITVSITGGKWDGTKTAQFVKIRGTEDETEEQQCVADFTKIGTDVTCKVNSLKNIGDIECIVWRTTGTDGWGFDKLKLKNGGVEKIIEGYHDLDDDETEDFCFGGQLYVITASITDGKWEGTEATQYVKIRGTQGETEEHRCYADFTKYGTDVTCKVYSTKNIGDIECIVWRTTGTDGWGFDKLKLKSGGVEKIIEGHNELDNSETKDFCFPLDYIINVMCDDFAKIYLDGVKQEDVEGHKKWRQMVSYTVPRAIKEIIVECKNKNIKRAFGIKAQFVDGEGKSVSETGKSWSCSTSYSGGYKPATIWMNKHIKNWKNHAGNGDIIWTESEKDQTAYCKFDLPEVERCGYIQHYGGKCIQPKDGSAHPAAGILLVVAPTCKEERVYFCVTPQGEIKQKTSGLCIQPQNGSDSPGNDERLVLGDCGSSAAKFKFLQGGTIQQVSSGQCWHPYGGSEHPPNLRAVVLHGGCDGSRKALRFKMNYMD